MRPRRSGYVCAGLGVHDGLTERNRSPHRDIHCESLANERSTMADEASAKTRPKGAPMRIVIVSLKWAVRMSSENKLGHLASVPSDIAPRHLDASFLTVVSIMR